MAGNTPISDVPDAPAIGAVADAGDGTTATVAYTASATGGAATTFTATSSPGSVTGTGSSPISVTGLAANTVYTFTVRASNSTGSSPASTTSSSLTIAPIGVYESIASVTVGSGGSSSIDFTSISSTYTHLQIRGRARGSSAGTGTDNLTLRFNSDTGTNYASHLILSNGSSTVIDTQSTLTYLYLKEMVCRGGNLSNVFSDMVIDILDYGSTNKNKTIRAIGGHDRNGAGLMIFQSGLWSATPAAITSINITAENNFAQYSTFALYGIKGA